MHIAIAGNIGAGKTTLASKLAEHYDWNVSFESVDNNPYLEDFYEDMPRWAFHLQVYFLNNRFNQVIAAQESHKPFIQDRTIYEDAHIFAKTLFEQGFMVKRDYENYLQIFQSLVRFIKAPDLLIYLRADLKKLKGHIQRRGRGFESNIEDDYLTHLNRQYEEWIEGYQAGRLLVLEINEIDFVNQESDWKALLGQIDSEIKSQV